MCVYVRVRSCVCVCVSVRLYGCTATRQCVAVRVPLAVRVLVCARECGSILYKIVAMNKCVDAYYILYIQHIIV